MPCAEFVGAVTPPEMMRRPTNSRWGELCYNDRGRPKRQERVGRVDEAPPLRALFCDDFRSVNGAGVGADDDLRRELTGFA
jgi:hypothetical protein